MAKLSVALPVVVVVVEVVEVVVVVVVIRVVVDGTGHKIFKVPTCRNTAIRLKSLLLSNYLEHERKGMIRNSHS